MILTLSYTSSADARSCWRKYYFHNILGLNLKKKTSALGVGTVIHECFEKYFLKSPPQDILNHIDASYQKMRTMENDPIELERLYLDHITCKAMWQNYPLNDLGFVDVQPEQSFKIAFLGRGNYLSGRVDGLVRLQDKWWIREVKTTSLSRAQFEGRAETSYQATGYVYGLMKARGIEVSGILFDVIKRPKIRKRTTENAEEFGKRLAAEYTIPEKTNFYYYRHYSYRSGHQVNEYLKDVYALVKEVRTHTHRGQWWRNPDACWTFGSACPYKRICWMDDLDEDVLSAYYDRRVHASRDS